MLRPPPSTQIAIFIYWTIHSPPSIRTSASVYLVCSALNRHFAYHFGSARIFAENVIGPQGVLRNTTRVLVTHGVSFLRAVDQIVHIHGEQPNCSSQSENVATTTFILEGQIVGTGTFDELMATDEKFADTIAEAQRVQEESESDEEQAGDDAASANEQIKDVELALRDEADAEESVDEHLPLAVGADEAAVESVAEMSAAPPSPVKRALTAVSDLADDSPKSPRRRRPHARNRRQCRCHDDPVLLVFVFAAAF